MEPNDLRSMDFKMRIKQSFAATHLNLSNQEKNFAPDSSNPPKIDEQRNVCYNYVYPKLKRDSNLIFPSDAEKSNEQNISSSITANSQLFNDSFVDNLHSVSQQDDSNNQESSVETDYCIEKTIAADAAELAKSFKKLKLKKGKKYSNLANSKPKTMHWNMYIKKALDKDSMIENPLKTPKDPVEDPFLDQLLQSAENVTGTSTPVEESLLYPELLESVETNPWIFHTLGKVNSEPLEEKEVPRQLSKNCNKVKQLTKREKEVLEILKAARTFKAKKKPSLNIFDGAGIDCFKSSEIKSSIKSTLPKNVPPPGGYVCVKPLPIEDVMKRPNLIIDDCWDNYDEW